MPSLATNLQTQDYQYAIQVPQGTWRWTTRVDVSKALVAFQIRDIVSPFGLLRDNIPLPGPVVTAMSESITELQQAFAPLIVLSPTTLTFTLNQGQGIGAAQTVTATNGGVYGSLLSPVVTTSASYITATPANVGGLAFNASGQFQVAVDSTNLLASSSPYAASITVQDSNATNTPQTIPVTINVLPLATITLSPTSLSFTASCPLPGNPFSTVPTQTFMITNTGPSSSVLDYQIRKLTGLSPWLVSFTPTFGELGSNISTNVTVSVAPTPWMQPGTYTEILRVSGYSTNFTQDLMVSLTIV